MSTSRESGQVKDVRVPRLLYQLHRHQKTGVLLLKRKDLRKAVFFRKGSILETRSNALRDCLGQMLVQAGKLSQEALGDSLRIMEGTSIRQGELFVKMGFLKAAELEEWLGRQQMERIWNAFEWTSGEFEFDADGGGHLSGHPQPVLSVIYSGISQRLGMDFLRKEFNLVRGNFYMRQESMDMVSSEVQISPPERDFYFKVPAEGTVESLLVDPRLEELPKYRFLYFCVQTGLIETAADKTALRTGATSRRIGAFGARDQLKRLLGEYNDKTFYEVLGVSPQAGREAVKEAYFAMAGQYHPDRFTGQGDDTRKMAEQVFSHINTAYSTLSDDATRQAYDATVMNAPKGGQEGTDMQSIVNAEIHYSKGMNLLKRKEYGPAVKAFQQAVELNPKEADYLAHLGWALFKDGSSPGGKEKAKDFLRKAIDLNPKMDRPYVFLGSIYKAEGQMEKAEQQFEAAVRCNPDNLDAMREIRMSTVRKGKEQTIWKKMFKK
ncbi:MAG: DnaJ domain-containing protein [Nitrospirae bacterium]|nr:DnaJ domain-containing protein [Nitrospirota bacterium]